LPVDGGPPSRGDRCQYLDCVLVVDTQAREARSPPMKKTFLINEAPLQFAIYCSLSLI